MWYSTRADGLDDPNHTKRNPMFNLGCRIGAYLRKGFLLQLSALTCIFLAYWWYGGRGMYTPDLKNMAEEDRSSTSFLSCIALLHGLYLLGGLFLLSFQAFAADDTCWARGYRSGSKIMKLAVFFDIMAAVFYFSISLFMAQHYSAKWFAHFQEGGTEWLFFVIARVLRAWAMAGYAVATYLLEVYHDEGAGDTHGYINAALFSAAALSEICVVFSTEGSMSMGIVWLALLAATVWAIFFEPEVNYVSPALHETELTNELEQQVENFARFSPQYPQAN